MREFRIRPVQITDIPALHRECWPQQTLHQVSVRLEELIRAHSPQSRWGAVAVAENTSVGYGQLSRWGSRAEICNLIVAERWRDQGAGTALIRWLIDLAQDMRFPVVEIGVAEANTRALELYQRLGFLPDRSLTLDVGSGPEPVLYLSLDLSSIVGPE